MSLSAASLAILLFFSGFASAQITAPNCSLSWEWSFNSLGQDPCYVTAYMMSTCYGGSYIMNPLLASDNFYIGPEATDAANLCDCSTVGYSLLSACGGCQGGEWITWSEYSTNCTKTLPPSTFPNPIPSGIRIPHWALLDVTNENDWDFNKSYAAGDSPEIGPGAILSPSGTSVPGSSTSNKAASSTAASNTATPIPVAGHSSSAGAIAGGIVGGIAAFSIVVAAMFLYRRRSSATSAGDGASGSQMNQAQWPMSGQETTTTLPETTTTLMKPYNPDDPTTFPGYDGSPSPPPVPAQVSSNRTLYTVARPPAQEYHGLPTV